MIAAALATVALAACGSGGSSGSGSSGGAIVATVGSTPITRAAVNHWMNALGGSIYYELSHRHTLPAGLVSDPPNYPRCVSQLHSTAVAGLKRHAPPTAARLLEKCRDLYQAIREQAMTFLINAQWLTNSYREYGVTVSDEEMQNYFRSVRAREFPTEPALQQYLNSRRLTLADEMLEKRLDLIAARGMKKIEGGGQQAFATVMQHGASWTAKTRCQPGYVVEHCQEYKEGSKEYKGPSAAVLMEQVAALATGRCINFAACKNPF